MQFFSPSSTSDPEPLPPQSPPASPAGRTAYPCSGSAAHPHQFSRFLRVWVLTMVFSAVGVAGFNWLINPYSIYRWSPTISGFNQIKPELDTRDRLVKAVDIIQQQPEHLIIGSSRTKQGIDPDHEAIEGEAYNAALNSISSYELRRYVEHAIATQPDLQKVTIGIDFFMFNQIEEVPVEEPETEEPETVSDDTVFGNSEPEGNVQSGFAEYRLERSHLSPTDILSTTLSLDAIVSSYQTLMASRQSPQAQPENENGFAPRDAATEKDAKWRFGYDLSLFFFRHHQFVLSPNTLTDFAEIVQLCKDAGVELTVFISPSHAVQWEAIAQSGEWETFEQWKKELVALTPVWDFSGYSSVTTEKVRLRMDYYRDNSHYWPIVGDWVLSRLFGTATQQQAVPRDFGVLLTPDTIDSHLAMVRQARQRWRRDNPSTLKWVNDIRRQALANKAKNTFSPPSISPPSISPASTEFGGDRPDFKEQSTE